MRKRKYQVAVILINYNSSQFTMDCIASLFEKTSPAIRFQVVVVDNASRPEEFRKLDLLKTKEHVSVFRSKLNTGFSGANMMGVQWADADYYYFLNNDCVLLEDCLSALYAFLESHPEAGSATGEMMNARGVYEANFGYFPVLASKILGTGLLRLIRPEKYPSRRQKITAPLRVEMINGSSMFVRATALEDIGGMDTLYFLYCEEEDMALRLLQAGFLTFLIPGAKYQHFVSQSTVRDNSINLVFLKEFYISFLYFYRKHYGSLLCRVIQGLYFLRMIRKFYRHWDYVRLGFFILQGAPVKYSLRYKQKMLPEAD